MAKRSRGDLSTATRRLKCSRKLTPSDYIKEFNEGDKVSIKLVPYYKKGKIPSIRYRGRVGTIIERRGDAYVVKIKDGGKFKKIIALPIFLQEVRI